MARATTSITKKIVQIVLDKEVQELTINLVLSKQEAETIMAICRRTGGSPADSRRKHTDAILQSLKAVGVETETYDVSQGIRFEDNYHG